MDELGEIDVLVVGAGNAACIAALTAREHGSRVVVLESAPQALRGGNSAFTGGAFRFAYEGVDDLLRLADISESELATMDFGSYTEDRYFDDMARMSQMRADPELIAMLVKRSYQTARWMRSQGVQFYPSVGRQAFKVDGKFQFWGGLALHMTGGGQQLVETLHDALTRVEIPVLYETPAVSLISEGGRIAGVHVSQHDGEHELRAKAVVLACGGFEANAEMRARYLGPGWDLAKVRGTRFNQGAGIRMAIEAGAMPYGHWSGAHSVAWDLNAPPFGDIAVGDQFQKHNVPFCIMVNADAERFLRTVREFNAAVHDDVPFNPNVLDGRRTTGLAIDKTNWANRLEAPPFEAYAVTAGVTFTFGGLKVTTDAQVEDASGRPIAGLYACGELVGGLYWHSYASGAGLMAGAVFGRAAGEQAARSAQALAAPASHS